MAKPEAFNYGSVTTQFDRLCKRAFTTLYPEGNSRGQFQAPPGAPGYSRGVRPDFVLPDGRWIDFKFRVSYRERMSVPWQPSALYASLRKYIDHVDNPTQSLIIVYKNLHGCLDDVVFPITRGRTVLLKDGDAFQQRIKLVDVRSLYNRIRDAGVGWIVSAIEGLD